MTKLSIILALVLVPAIAAADDDVVPGGVRIGITPSVMFESSNGQSETGYGGNLSIGYELEHGTLGITPMLDLGYASFSSTPSTNLAFAIPTLQLAFHEGRFVPAVEVGVGYGYAWASANGTTISDNYLALSVGAQLDYRVTPGFLLGIAAHYKPFLEPALTSFIDVGVNATFAL
jgi:Outer membrane protein beta-barrel domain